MKTKIMFLLRFLLFWVIFLLLLSVCARLFTPKSNRDWEDYQAAAFYGEEPGTIDVLFLGDSVTAEGISPMELWKADGIAAIVSAGPWFSVCRSYYTLLDALKTQTPRLVVLEVDSLFAKEERTPLENALSTILEYYFPIIRYHDRWKDLTGEDLSTAPSANWRSVTKGYSYQSDILAWPGADYRTPSGDAWAISKIDQFFLAKIQGLCADRDIPLLLLQLPCAATWRYPIYNAVSAYAGAHGLPLLDLNPDYEAFNLDWQTDTRDGGNHLNYSGAKKVSLWLSEYLSAHYELPDRRDDPRYESWSANWELYCDAVQCYNHD